MRLANPVRAVSPKRPIQILFVQIVDQIIHIIENLENINSWVLMYKFVRATSSLSRDQSITNAASNLNYLNY